MQRNVSGNNEESQHSLMNKQGPTIVYSQCSMLPADSGVIEEEMDELTNKCIVLIISETIARSGTLWSSNNSLDKDVIATATI